MQPSPSCPPYPLLTNVRIDIGRGENPERTIGTEEQELRFSVQVYELLLDAWNLSGNK
jgi:hypothetical protein